MLDTLLTTITHRPYVVAFLLAYIVIAVRTAGWRWMFSYLILGYTVAFLSEFSSIHFGFPYGWYFYDYENLKGEWLNHGVPVWDSVSYVFMNFAGLGVAKMMQPLRAGKPAHSARIAMGQSWPQCTPYDNIQLIILSAVFVTLLDVIVDPVAHRGAEWFLGHIYYYPTPGPYFDVTLANFAGWFLVSLIINAMGVLVLGFPIRAQEPGRHTGRPLQILGLYFGIVGFGVAIAVGLKAWGLLLCDIFWVALILIIIWHPLKKIS